MATAFRLELLALTCACLLAACAAEVTVRPFTAAEIEQARSGARAVVLLQLEAVVDDQVVPATGASEPNRSFRIYVARMDRGETPVRIAPAAMSEEAAVSGWRHLSLEPGTYFVLILPPGVEQNPPAVAYHAASGKFGRLTRYRFEPGRGGFWALELMAFVLPSEAPEDFRELPGFWIDVPAGRPLLYAGSLRVVCTDGRGLGGLIDSCSDFERKDDIANAQRIASSIPQLGPPSAAPLVVYGKPRDPSATRGLAAMPLAMAPWSSLGVIHAGARLAPWGVVHGVERPILVYNLLAILVHGLQQAAAAKDADLLSEEARACMQRLSSELTKIDGEAHFRAAVRRARAPDATPAALDRARLVVQPTALRLRGSAGTDRLSLELALHVRLETGTASTVAYESRLVYAEPFPRDNPLEGSTRLYERRTAQVPGAYPLALWCGADGDKLLESEIAQGLAAIAAQLVGDLE